MKKVIAGCIDLMLEFDSASELDRYIADIEVKKQEYSIVDRKELPGDRIMIRIHRQYNKSPFPTTAHSQQQKVVSRMNKKLLRSEMVLHDDTNGTLAEALGISQQSFSAKLNETNGAEFNQGEISKIRSRYNLSDEKVVSIFFN